MSKTKKVALITGSSRGIGKAIALEFAKNGYVVIATYHKNKVVGQQSYLEIKKINSNVDLYHLDVSSYKSITECIKKIINKYGRIDVLVNNAGILQQKEFTKITSQDFDQIIKTNLRGPFLLSKKIFPYMRRNKYGRIINIASIGGQYGGPKAPHYSASKAGLISLTRSLARLGAPYNITCNCLSPGQILTSMTKKLFLSKEGNKIKDQIPLGRFGKPEEVAYACLFLASDRAGYITGQTLNINGGLYFG